MGKTPGQGRAPPGSTGEAREGKVPQKERPETELRKTHRLLSEIRASPNRDSRRIKDGKFSERSQAKRTLRHAAELMRTAPGQHPRRAVKAAALRGDRAERSVPVGAAHRHGSASPGRNGRLCQWSGIHLQHPSWPSVPAAGA